MNHERPRVAARGFSLLDRTMKKQDINETNFWNKVDRKSENECWEWLGTKDKKGYGKFNIQAKCKFAHRASYAIANDETPDYKLVCHSCDNPSCVNPNHLWLGTHKQNCADKMKKGRYGEAGFKKGFNAWDYRTH